MTVRTRRRLTRRLLGTGALAMGLVAAGAGVASAHVTVSAPGATPGGSDTVITFRVPNESTARTVGLKVRMPSETPIASVLVQPKPGWSATVSRSKLGSPIKTDDGEITEVISEIDWKVSAPSQGIGPGQFDEFVVLAGQLPDAASLTFKAIQSYSDGSTVSWIEEPAPDSSAAPEHPAPVLNLGGGSGSSGSATGGSSEPASPGSQSGSASPSGFSSHAESGAAQPADAASKATAVTGIVLGALGVLLGLAALAVAARRRRV